MKKILILVFLCAAVLLGGCWDRREVNDMLLITAAGIDKKSVKEIELSVQVINPIKFGGGQQEMTGSGGRGGEELTFMRSAEGVTIADAMSKLQEKFPRRIFWGQTAVFIIGEQLAKDGIQEQIEFLARHPEPRLDAFVFVSKGKAADILELAPPLERSSSEVLRELAEMQVAMRVTLKDLLQMLGGEAGAAALPWIEPLPPRPGESKKQTIPYIQGTAVFKKDKMVGHIDDKVTRGLLWIRDEIGTATVTVTPKAAEGFVSLFQLRANTEQIPKIENGKWKMTVKVFTEDDIVQNSTKLNLMNPKFVKMLEKELEEAIEKRIRMALTQVQKGIQADIFGFAETFHRKYPKEWEREKECWDEVFPMIEVKVKVKAYIRRQGKATIPSGLPKNEVKEK